MLKERLKIQSGLKCSNCFYFVALLSGFLLFINQPLVAETGYYEKIYLHTDRDFYVAGEKASFKVYLLTGGESIEKSSVVYVELSDIRLNSILKTTIELNNSSAFGILSIPDTLFSGTYIIKAYTNWLRNFGHEYVFLKQIDIVNRFGKFKQQSVQETTIDEDSPVKNTNTPNANNILIAESIDSVILTYKSQNNLINTARLRWVFYQKGKELTSIKITQGQDLKTAYIKKQDLPPGTIKISLFDGNTGLASIFFYNKNQVNQINVKTNKSTFKKREKVELTINLNDTKIISGVDLSLSISEEIPGKISMKNYSICEWMDYYSEFGNSSTFSYNQSISNAGSSTDEIWLYDKISKQHELIYPIESNGLIISGRVVQTSNNTLVKGALVYLSLIDSYAYLNYDYTDSAGRFYFSLPKVFNKSKIIVQVWDAPSGREKCKLIIDKSVNNGLESENHINILNADYYSGIYAKQIKAFEIASHFSKKKQSETTTQTDGFNTIYNNYKGLNTTVYPKDFIKLSNFSEIAREILPGVRFKDEGSDYSIRIFNEKQSDYFKDEPLVLVNGFPIKDYSPIATLNSDDITHIDIVQKYFLVGQIINPGLLSIQLANPEGFQVTSADYLKLLSFNVSESYRNAGFPTYEIENQRNNSTPDFRNTMFWGPDIKVGDDGLAHVIFYTADNSGTFTIQLQGIVNQAIPVFYQTTIKVEDEY